MSSDLARVLVCTLLIWRVPAICSAQQEIEVYAGGLVGVATLSADARSVVSEREFAVSLYEPQNGLAVNLLLGAHLHNYVTIQGNYIWNRNDLMLVSTQTSGATQSFSQEFRESTHHMVIGDLLVYFRPRGDRIRPYLSGGLGVMRFRSESDADLPRLDPTEVRATLRVAVGMDVKVGDGWSIRYSFSENLSGNPISDLLVPPGKRSLANFQNLVGGLWSF